MKALQTRSPIHLYFSSLNLESVNLRLFVNKDVTAFDVTNNPDYNLTATAINDEVTVEIAELLRSKNDYLFDSDFYTKRDTAIYALVESELISNVGTTIETQYNLLRIRDGYVERNEQIQLLNNEVTTKVNDWNASLNTSFTPNQTDVFSGNNAILAEDINDSQQINVRIDNLNLSGLYTFSVWLKPVNGDAYKISFNSQASREIVINLNTLDVSDVGFAVLAYDAFKVNDWVKVSLVCNEDVISGFRILSDQPTTPESVLVFNPTAIKGNWLNSDASDLVLQSNYTHYTDGNIQSSFMADRKKANTTYFYPNSTIGNFFTNNPNAQSYQVLVDESSDLIYTQLDGTETRQTISLIELCEPKYTPVKISFINKFGVIQDLVFFKKRVDTVRTTEDSYKANILQNGQSLNHVGQRQILRKNSMRSVKISSGFYPEDFNTVFEQLLNSLNYWIDDEPAVLKSSNWTEKTSVNDKLINYDFDFEFANDDINNIR